MQPLRGFIASLMALLLVAPANVFASNHREAPITALDHPADITDWYAFVSYDDPSKVTMILNVDPLLDPGNGPNYFPFDPDVLYTMRVDNNQDGDDDIVFEFRFQTEYRAPGLFTGFLGVGNGVNTPSNAPKAADGTVTPSGVPLIPPAVTALDGKGSEGINIRQTYTVTMVKGTTRTDLTGGKKLFAVPNNVGSRTMPDYPSLAKQGIYSLANGVRVFAGTVDDPFYIDLGGAFDTLNFRGQFPSGIAGVLQARQDQDNNTNFAPDSVAGYNVNTIVLELPIAALTSDGQRHAASDPKAVIGTYGATYRPRMTIRRLPGEATPPDTQPTEWRQVQRMGHPLINELIIGTGSKDTFSMSEPKDDSQFANFFLDPLLARALNAVYGLKVPDAPRLDLAPLVFYAPPIAPAGTPQGPLADLLRLNTGVPPTPAASRSRLGAIAGDLGGYPNGRRVSDDVVDIALRAVAGILAGPQFSGFPYNSLGDGVNTNDVPYQETFPYEAWANSGLTTKIVQKPKNIGSLECLKVPNACQQ
jgi:hypothetical protein